MAYQVSDAELVILRIIWENGGTAFFAQIMSELDAAGYTWGKNTVITLLARLMEKGVLQAKKLGRRNEYTALVSEGTYQTEQTERFVDRIYQGDAKGLVSNLIQSEMLDPAEYEELKRLLERGRARK